MEKPKRVIKDGKKCWKLGEEVYLVDTSHIIWNKPDSRELIVDTDTYNITVKQREENGTRGTDVEE